MMGTEKLYVIPDGVATKWASAENTLAATGGGGKERNGRKGSACFQLPVGGSAVLAQEESGAGTIRRIWATIPERTPETLRGILLEMYWDGADTPAVSAPFGDFFGIGLGRTAAFESALFSNPEGRSFNCFAPMPFRNGMKIVVTNNSNQDISMFYYDVDYTVGDIHDDKTLYFHARFNRQNPTELCRDFEILPRINGKGRFLGCNIGVNADVGQYFTSWWGEGEVKIYLDDDCEFPSLCGTGTEDYIGTGWGQGRYDNMYQGCTVADMEKMQYCFYRYHIPDPVYFRSGIRVTIQQMGCWNPATKPLFAYYDKPLQTADGNIIDFAADKNAGSHGLFERRDDWSCCAYFYLDRPDGEE